MAAQVMKRLNWKQWSAMAALVLVLFVTGLFAVRTFRRAIYWRMHHDEVIRPWMSVPYVAHSYRVPPPVLYEALGIPPLPHDRRPIRDIAEQQNRSVDEAISVLQNAIARERSMHPPGSPPSPEAGRSP